MYSDCTDNTDEEMDFAVNSFVHLISRSGFFDAFHSKHRSFQLPLKRQAGGLVGARVVWAFLCVFSFIG